MRHWYTKKRFVQIDNKKFKYQGILKPLGVFRKRQTSRTLIHKLSEEILFESFSTNLKLTFETNMDNMETGKSVLYV